MEVLSSISASILNRAKRKEGLFGSGFTTSADVVMKAGGLRLEAIRVMAREQGVEIEDTACRCIDENLLAVLADAHVRKMKAYFNNAKRHIAELGGDELATFIDFCQTFKKRQTSNSAAWKWTDIDADAIRELFLQKVYDITPSASIFELFAGCGNFEFSLNTPNFKPSGDLDTCAYKRNSDVIDKVLHSYLFYAKPVNTLHVPIDIRSVVRRTTLSSRYHIFSSEDEDHLQDTINTLSLNRAPAMVA